MSNNNTPIFIQYEPEQFWEEMRKIVKEEVSKINTRKPTDQPVMEVPGLTYKPLFTIAEVCSLFQITKPTIYEWIDREILKPMKIQSRVYFLHQDIHKLMTDGNNNRK